MDLNDLYHSHQVALMRARAAISAPVRAAHMRVARILAARINDFRRTRSADGPARLRIF